MILHFTCRYMFHFKGIFVKGVRSVSRFIFKTMNNQWFQHQRSVDYIYVGVFLGSLFFHIDPTTFFCKYHAVLINCSFLVNPEIGYCESLNFALL